MEIDSHVLAAIGGSIPGAIVAAASFLRSRGRRVELDGEANLAEVKADAAAIGALVSSLTNARNDLVQARQAYDCAVAAEKACAAQLSKERQAREQEDERCRKNLAALAKEIDDMRAECGQPRKMLAIVTGEHK